MDTATQSADEVRPQLTTNEKAEKRKQQLRDAQKRYYEKNKKKNTCEPPKSYTADYMRDYHRSYYQKHKDLILNRAKDYYTTRRTTTEV